MVDSEDNSSTPKTTNNGPRVSFNRDVHVKRYGSLLLNNENCESNSRSQSPNLRRELPADLSHEALEREAALVLEQVNSFGSLPHRKHNYKKPLRRSKSDASSKKSKRNSIFNFFNSTPASLTNTSTNNSNTVINKTPINEKVLNNNNNNKKVARSKSDVSSQSLKYNNKNGNKLKLNQSFNDSNFISSDSDNNTFLTSNLHCLNKIPLSPITEINTPLLDESNQIDYFKDSSVVNNNNNSSNNIKNEGLLTDENGENSLKHPNKNLKYLSKSMESMHSSQMPAEKLPLTKNVRVDKIIKRLSVERLSPPPLTVLQAGGFSYTNPQLSPNSPTKTTIKVLGQSQCSTKDNNKSRTPTPNDYQDTNRSINYNHNNILYTQVVCNEIKKSNADDNKTIQNVETAHNTIKTSRKSATSPINLTPKHNVYNITDYEKSRNDTNDFINNIAADDPRSSAKTYHNQDDSNKDETDNVVAINEEEPIIKANIRQHMPRYSSSTNIDNLNNCNNNQINYYLDNEFDQLNEMRETDYNGIDVTLSSRREILESRIKSRIGGLHHINNDNNHTRLNPPTIVKRTHNKHYGSNEFINNRFSPERKHLDFNKSTSPSTIKYEQKMAYLEDGSMRKNVYSQRKYNDNRYTDSGNETDIVAKNNSYNRNRYSSRFNIGRKWNYEDDIIECELFLMKERKHTEETYPYQLVRTYVHRQHTANDDTYDTDQDKKNIIKEWKHNKKMTREFLKSQTKKKSGLDKVKELFKLKSSKNNAENELRARYREYSPEIEPPPQKSSLQTNIVNRRRLSTPTSSPMTANRSKSLPPKVAVHRNSSTLRKEKQNNSNTGNSQKFNWFTSLDRLSRKKSRESSVNTPTIDRSSSITRAKSASLKNISTSNGSSKNLRFFGDTDVDETGSRHKSSYYDEAREKSSSLQNLNAGRRTRQSKSVSRSRAELNNIAESTSDEAAEKPISRSRPVSPSINNYLPPPRPPKSTKLVRSVSTLPRPLPRKAFPEENNIDHDSYYPYKKDSMLESDLNFSTNRRLRNSLSVSRENVQRDRFDSDASQRSVVYLHASVVGDIPQTYGRKMSGKSIKTAYNEEQPIVRTVNNSLSMDAPWKPKFISDGYEINYSNDQKDVANDRRKYRSKSATREKNQWNREVHKRL